MTQKAILPAPHPWYGAFWKIASCAFFAGINGIVKLLSQSGPGTEGLPPYELAFFQNIFGLLFMLPWVWQDRTMLKTNRIGLHCFRAGLAVMGVILWYTSLKYLKIVQAVALNFTGPIFTILLARMFLGEVIPGRRWLAIGFGFLGAFIAGRPDLVIQKWDSDFLQWITVLPLLSAFAINASLVVGKKLTTTDSPKTIALYLLLLMAPVSFIPCMMEWETPMLWQWPYLVLMGLFAAGAHYSLNKALSYADVTFLIPFGLSRLLFSAAIGYIIFFEIPSARVWVGTAVIVLAILTIDYSTAARKR